MNARQPVVRAPDAREQGSDARQPEALVVEGRRALRVHETVEVALGFDQAPDLHCASLARSCSRPRGASGGG